VHLCGYQRKWTMKMKLGFIKKKLKFHPKIFIEFFSEK
jgi:hypothetical protein